ncbi:hypothetical protein UPYG_G00129990 [Umbra pygmaea]|uniref:Uncharacterized protein n=1 Tax=Umbra pygmaea TaxID=75934 RepID=A0ABD0XRV2_UMBPY
MNPKPTPTTYPLTRTSLLPPTWLHVDDGTPRVTSPREWSRERKRSAAKFKQKDDVFSRFNNGGLQHNLTTGLSMSSSVKSGLGGGWRAHTVLEESDGGEVDSPQGPTAPDRFRKLRSSSSLNTLRMSLKKRLPLRSVQTNSLPDPELTPDPTWESLQANQKTSAVQQLKRSTRSHIGGVYQRFQRGRAELREECLVATPHRVSDGTDNIVGVSTRTPRHTPVRSTTLLPSTTPKRTARATPKRTPKATVTPKRTPASGRRGKKTPGVEASPGEGVRNRGGRRQLVRMAALRSPFASPNTESMRRVFARDLECVSSGLRKLKRLSHAFDEVIGRDDRRTLNYSLITE